MAETWDSQTFSESDAVGEEEERFPAPSRAEINSPESVESLPWPAAEIAPDKHKCPSKPLGTWGSAWLSPLRSIPGSPLPGGSITHSLVLWGYRDGGWKFSSSQPMMCKPVSFPLPPKMPQTGGPPSSHPFPSSCLCQGWSRWKSFLDPGSALKWSLPNKFIQRFVSLGIIVFFPVILHRSFKLHQ